MKHAPTPRIQWGVALVAGLALTGACSPMDRQAASAGGADDARPAAEGHHAAPLWRADPAKGTAAFEGTETKPGSVKVVDDPAGKHGKSFQLHTSGDKIDGPTRVRVETRGHRTADGPLRFSREGDVYYIGWRSMWGPLPTKKGDWVVLWQLKDYGSGAATPPLSLRARGDGAVDLEYADPQLKTTRLWHTPLTLDTWHDFVIGIKVSKDPSRGWVRLWHNGTAQKLPNGKEQYPAATLRADWVTDKWGVYRSDGVKGQATAWLNSPAVGRSYQDVAPTG
ncbi:heparin lyase I family protein [Streptomyces sp. NPDC093097]|uniref:heparin lyase I family protein n=1 Tax=Streptomyces sp. NPDC093097 TaxID=3366027 RepID=UPI003827B492